MITMFSDITTKLKSLAVKLAGSDLEKSTVKSIELAYCNTRPSIKGQLYFEDLYDLNMFVNWESAKVQITFIDMLDDMFTRTFHVVNVEKNKEQMSRKTFLVDFVDEFSYALANSYISRSFNVPLNQAVLEIAKDLGVDNLPHIDFDFSDVPYDKPYVTSKNINSLTYFTRELYRNGYTFYQTKTGIHIKSLDDLIPGTLITNGDFSDHPTNQYYMNKIHFFDVLQNNRNSVSASNVTITYDPLTKENKRIVENPLDELRLNSKPIDLSKSVGTSEFLQSQQSSNQRRLDLKREYMDQNIIEIYVSGFVKNDLNKVYNLFMKGNDTYIESQMRGDELLSGKYVSKLIQEKIVLDSYVQKITIHRADQIDTRDISERDEEFGGSFDDF